MVAFSYDRVSRRCAGALSVLFVAFVFAGVVVTSAGAVVSAPHWTIQASEQPTSFKAKECPNTPEESESPATGARCARFSVLVSNVGANASSGPVTIGDDVPAGLRIITKTVGVEKQTVIEGQDFETKARIPCTVSGQHVQCSYGSAVAPGDTLELWIAVEVAIGTAAGPLADNAVSVGGGGATTVSTTSPVTVDVPQSFRLVSFGFEPVDNSGRVDLLAGDHPTLLTVNFETPGTHEPGNASFRPLEYLKDAVAYLPAGMVGNPTILPRCPLATALLNIESCPTASRIGSVVVDSLGGFPASVQKEEVSFIYNAVPEKGYPAEFVFSVFGRPIVVAADLVHDGVAGGYTLRTGSSGILKLQSVSEIKMVSLSFWGNPSAHNGGSTSSAAFLTNPTDCSGAVNARMEVDSWEKPGNYVEKETTAYPQLAGCASLSFAPSFTLRPESTIADSPSGYETVVRVPQSANVSPALATAQLKDARI